MMKHFKTMIAMLLLAAMLLSLCACGEDQEAKPTEATTEPTTEEPTTEPTTTEPTTTEPTTTEPTTEEPTELVIDHEILGTWEFALPCADMMEQTLLGAGYDCDFSDDLAINLYFTFHEDGTYEMQADEASAQAVIQEMLNAIATLMPDMLYAEFAKQGWDKETTDAQLAAQGLTMEALVETTMSQIDPSAIDFSSSYAAQCFYTIDGDSYYLASTMENLLAGKYIESLQFSIEGDTMQILSCEIYDEDAASIGENTSFPMELTRK